jgi:hypothetical protein
MNITIDSDSPIYRGVINSGLTATELVILGLKTVAILTNKLNIQDALKSALDVEDDYEEPDLKVSEKNHLELLNEIQKLNLNIGGSSQKGKVAEDIICSNLCGHFPYAEITNTTGIAQKGDLIVKINGLVIMIEIKNYKINVGSKEKDKFYRDATSNDYDASILVSCSSGIVGKHSRFEHEEENGAILMYISNAGNDGLSIMWSILFITASMDMIKKSKNTPEYDIALIFRTVNAQLIGLTSDIEHLRDLKDSVLQTKTSTIRVLELGTARTIKKVDKLSKSIQYKIDEFSKVFAKPSEEKKVGELEEKTNDIPPPRQPAIHPEQIRAMILRELRPLGEQFNIPRYRTLRKAELVAALIEAI